MGEVCRRGVGPAAAGWAAAGAGPDAAGAGPALLGVAGLRWAPSWRRWEGGGRLGIGVYWGPRLSLGTRDVRRRTVGKATQPRRCAPGPSTAHGRAPRATFNVRYIFPRSKQHGGLF